MLKSPCIAQALPLSAFGPAASPEATGLALRCCRASEELRCVSMLQLHREGDRHQPRTDEGAGESSLRISSKIMLSDVTHRPELYY
eukprot:1378761-Pleurochrysis_carterae.AAC.2